MLKPLVVIPTYNEATNIGDMLQAVLTAVPSASILVVDDGSPDGTSAVVERVVRASEPGRVQLLQRPGKAGLGAAYRDGFRWGIAHGYDVLVQMDADFQHDPLALPGLLAPLATGADSVIGSRYVGGGSVPGAWPLHRKLLSRGANLYARTLLRLPQRDVTAGFRAHQSTLIQDLDLDSIDADGYGFQIGLTYRCRAVGAAISEVPIRFGERNSGTSKMSFRIMIEAWWLVTSTAFRRRRQPRRSAG